MRERAPAGMEIAAGEYGYTLDYFRRMLAADAVDVLQADVTRCGGITGFLQVAALCDAHHVAVGHCAPALHLHAACAAPRLRHQEWFHDHVRIEHMLFDGAPRAKDGGSARTCRAPAADSSSRLATRSAIDRMTKGSSPMSSPRLTRLPAQWRRQRRPHLRCVVSAYHDGVEPLARTARADAATLPRRQQHAR